MIQKKWNIIKRKVAGNKMIKVEIGRYNFQDSYTEYRTTYIMDTTKEVIFETLKNNFSPSEIDALYWESIGSLLVNNIYIHVEEVNSLRLDKFLDIVLGG